MKKIYLLSGCNGAGKTTVSYALLPELLDCKEFVNADFIAKGISPHNPNSVDYIAGRLMIERINYLIHSNKTFAIETTLTTLSYKNLLINARDNNYKIILLFIWLRNSKLAIKRVDERMKKGGHFVEKNIIERRYKKGILNFFNIFAPLSDEWYIFDNSGLTPILVANGGINLEVEISNKNIYSELIKVYEKINKG